MVQHYRNKTLSLLVGNMKGVALKGELEFWRFHHHPCICAMCARSKLRGHDPDCLSCDRLATCPGPARSLHITIGVLGQAQPTKTLHGKAGLGKLWMDGLYPVSMR